MGFVGFGSSFQIWGILKFQTLKLRDCNCTCQANKNWVFFFVFVDGMGVATKMAATGG